MVGAVCVVGSQLADSKTSCVCLCLDAITPSSSQRRGDSIGSRKPVPPPRSASLELSTSFLHHSSMKALLSGSMKGLAKQRKKRWSRLVILDNLGGQYEDNFEDVHRQMLDFFTYKAVRTVLYQLYEMNPTRYRWFYDYVASNEHGYGKSFIRNLAKVNYDLAERVLVTRLHLYGKWVKKCDHVEMYKRISNQNLELLRERLLETVVWPPSDDSNTEEVIG